MNLTDLYAQVPVAQHSRIIVYGDRVWLHLPTKTREFILLANGELEQISERAAELDIDALRAEWIAATSTDGRVRIIAKRLGLQ